MQSLLSFALTSLAFVGIYQFLAPRFSNGGVSFASDNFWHKMLFGVSMNLGVSLVMFAAVFIGSATVIPATILLAGSAMPIVLPIVVGLLLITVLQTSHWLATVIMGKLMPTIIKVESSKAAFRGAWAPTLVFGLLYGVIVAAFLIFGIAMSVAS